LHPPLDVRTFELRQTRYRGLAKAHLQHTAIAAAINLDRIVAWLEEIPRAQPVLPVLRLSRPSNAFANSIRSLLERAKGGLRDAQCLLFGTINETFNEIYCPTL
jgi:hypothetical protein